MHTYIEQAKDNTQQKHIGNGKKGWIKTHREKTTEREEIFAVQGLPKPHYITADLSFCIQGVSSVKN